MSASQDSGVASASLRADGIGGVPPLAPAPVRATDPLAGEGRTALRAGTSPSQSTGPAGSDVRRVPFGKTTPAMRAEMAQRIRAIMDADVCTVREAARSIGISDDVLRRIARENNLKSSAEALRKCAVASAGAASEYIARQKAEAMERDRPIVALLPSLTVAQIAKQLGTNISRVYRAAERAGIKQFVVSEQPAQRSPRAQGIADAEALRKLVLSGRTVRESARILGWSRSKAREVASAHKIKASPEVLAAASRAAARKAAAMCAAMPRKPKPLPPPKRLTRNPFLTEAQQKNVDAQKRSEWADPRLRALPPVTDDEAARLVAEFAARRGVTVCPPSLVIEPSNAGAKWK